MSFKEWSKAQSATAKDKADGTPATPPATAKPADDAASTPAAAKTPPTS